MTDVSYVTTFRKLRIAGRIAGHLELIPRVNITNDPSTKARLLTPQFSRAAGAIETQDLQIAHNLVFGEFESSEMKDLPPEAFFLGILIWIDMLLKNAWFVKDHAMECDAAFLRVSQPRGTSWTRNFVAGRPSFADGRTGEEVEMSVAELETWGKTNDIVESYLHESKSLSLRFMMEKGYTRSGRAMQFISAARRAPDLAFKIAHYCSALETLFTTDSAELAHKLSERVAFFLGERGHSRPAVFATVKNAYGVRSKLVHGDTLKAGQITELPDLSVRIDQYLRVILSAIFNSDDLKKVFDSKPEDIEEYFSRLILGA
jgi:Apea-like HEPN